MFSLEGLLTGQTLLDRYRVGEVLGRGGMGVVYRARDLKLNREIALKVLTLASPDATVHQRLRARLAREAKVAAGIQHPNVVAVYDHGTDPSLRLDFLTMELLQGEDLATRLRRVGFPRLRSALQVIVEAAAGLAAGHRAGLVHRDVKPGNLFLTVPSSPGSPTVKVLDFGIAQGLVDTEWTLTQAEVGAVGPLSPAFASPEQLRGSDMLTPASDVFSLGAVAYSLLTGRRAFRSADAHDSLPEEVHSSITRLRQEGGIPAAIVDVLERSLAPDPIDRFRDAGALLAALEPEIASLDHRSGALLPSASLDSRAVEGSPPPHLSMLATALSSPATLRFRELTPGDAVPALLILACWIAGASFLDGSGTGLLIALAASAVAAAWGATRLLGTTGLRFGILATLALTAVVLLLVGGLPTSAGGFAALCLAQLLMAPLASWLATPPRDSAPAPEDDVTVMVDSW